jgi:DNA-binding NarL/FixJ family response regulator
MAHKQQTIMSNTKHQPWPVRVALVSNNPLLRVGLEGVLRTMPGIQLIGKSNGGAQACALIRQMKPDCVIIDLESDTNLLESVKNYKQFSPQTRVLLFADWNDMERARVAIGIGAEGIVLKCQPLFMLLAMIENKQEEPPSITLAFPEIQPAVGNNTKPHVRKAPVNHIPSGASLTERERSVVALVGQGLSNRDISDRLSISDITVRHHLTRIFDKLGVASRQKLLISAYHLGLVDLTTSAQDS